mgnify:CR=1 FL=1
MVKKYGRTDLLLPDTGRTDVPRLFTLAAQGDADCTAIADYAADTLACVIMNLVRVSDPDTVVFGGGIMSDAWFHARQTGTGYHARRYAWSGAVQLQSAYCRTAGGCELRNEVK